VKLLGIVHRETNDLVLLPFFSDDGLGVALEGASLSADLLRTYNLGVMLLLGVLCADRAFMTSDGVRRLAVQERSDDLLVH